MRKSLVLFLVFVVCSFSPLFSEGKGREKIPKRIICLDSSLAEDLYFLGVGDRIVGVTRYCHWPAEIARKPKVGRGFGDINLEMIISLKPDIIFCWEGRDVRILSGRGFRLFVVHPSGVKGILDMILRMGKVVGKYEKAEEIVSQMRKRIEKVKKIVKKAKRKPLVYFEGSRLGSTRAPGSLTHDLITLAGGINLAGSQPIPFPILSNEFIIQSNPDVIIVEQYGASIEEIKRRPGWERIKAVRNNRIFKQRSYYTFYSPRLIEGLEQYTKWFHPELFAGK